MDVASFDEPGAATSPPNSSTSSVELRELRCFLSVARTGNFGRAARELNVAQPTISYQIRKLEAGLGTQLLVRHGRGVTLTPAGSSFCHRIGQVFQLLASPLETGALVTSEPGTTTLAVPSELGALLIAPVVEQFRCLWSSARLDIQEGSGAVLMEWLQRGRVDIAIVQDPSPVPDVETCSVVSEGLGLVVSARSPLAEETRPLRFRDIAHLPLILPNQEHWIRRKLDRAAYQAGIQLGASVQVDSVALTKTMVRKALGYTVLPGITVQDELARGALVFRPIIRPSLFATHAIAYRRSASSAFVPQLAHLLSKIMVSLVEIGSWPGAQANRQVIEYTTVEMPTASPSITAGVFMA
jgi:LysR family nitrogen assimilation transcriptional regulator